VTVPQGRRLAKARHRSAALPLAQAFLLTRIQRISAVLTAGAHMNVATEPRLARSTRLGLPSREAVAQLLARV
jgi:hypothetical protein